MEAGDGDARNMLIEKNLRLVAHISKKYEQSHIDKDDLISIGTIGLIKAIDTFSSDRNVRLATYAARCIDNEILMAIRAGKNLDREMSLYEPLGRDKEGNEVSLFDILENEDLLIEDKVGLDENIRILLSVMNRVGEKRQEGHVVRQEVDIAVHPEVLARHVHSGSSLVPPIRIQIDMCHIVEVHEHILRCHIPRMHHVGHCNGVFVRAGSDIVGDLVCHFLRSHKGGQIVEIAQLGKRHVTAINRILKRVGAGFLAVNLG
ncbi:MAG: sigma-70 family RNA polymerase sigma factor, partial [Firmicutes bacterium]|nr:sigma-70 family RNA polymerase sigma factor [Bacillota bacterium]